MLVTGKYISVIKDLAYPNAIVETRLVKPGDIAVIRPNVAHTMVFLEDSIFLNLVRGEREHENYGITHTIPYKLVDDKFRDELIAHYKYACRSCGSIDLKDFISLGLSPLANNLLDTAEKCDMYPLEVKYCAKCKNAQLSFTVPPQKMFDNYLYVSSTAASFRKHFEDAAETYIKEFNLTSNDLVIDIGSNDGIFLKPLKERGIKILGIEPATNIAHQAIKNGIPTTNAYFNKDTTDFILEKFGKAELVTASNVFAHSDELVNMTNNAFRLLKSGGTFVIEVQYLMDTINDLTFDNIYHEHTNYWSVTSLVNFFKKNGANGLELVVTKVEHINTHGGSIRVYVNYTHTKKVHSSVSEFLAKEYEFGMDDYNTYRQFAKNVNEIKDTVNDNMRLLKSEFKKIAAYGSPAKATTALNYFGIDSTMIEYTIEDNQLKNNKFIPGVNIPIKNKEYCNQNLPDLIIVLAWNFFEDIKRNNQDLINKGVTFISIKDLQNKNMINGITRSNIYSPSV